jgi:DNA-binding MarR family transcriptional regulator
MNAPISIPPNKAFSLLVWDVARLIRKAIDARANEVGLTSAQWHVLSTLARCAKMGESPLNQASLADLLDIEPITLSRQIDRLTAAGMIERRPDPSDRRAHLLYLTEKARPLVMAFRDVATEVLNNALAGISAREVDALIDVLERIRANVTGKTVSHDTNVPATKAGAKEGIPS